MRCPRSKSARPYSSAEAFGKYHGYTVPEAFGPGPVTLWLKGRSSRAVVRHKRDALMAKIRTQLDHEAQQYGIRIIDVRIRRADLPEQNSQAVYQRMQTERQREAAEFRAQGAQRAQEIRARADREVTVLVADATNKSDRKSTRL